MLAAILPLAQNMQSLATAASVEIAQNFYTKKMYT